ncbi:MAG: DMT family transporter, partial [Bacteroidota bacterium]
RTSFFKNNQVMGALMVLLGAIFFSTKAVLIKLAYQYQVDAFTLFALRMLFSLPFFVLLAQIEERRHPRNPLKTRDWLHVALVGIMGFYVAGTLDFLGLQYITASLERLVLFAYPSLVVIISAILYKHKIRGIQYLALLLTYVGIGMALVGDLSLNQQENVWLGVMLIFGTALAFSIYFLGSAHLIPRLGSIRFNAYTMCITSVLVISQAFVLSPGQIWVQPLEVYGLSLLMALLSTVLATTLMTAGIGKIGASNAAIISSTGPISTIILASIFLDEMIGSLQIFGTLLVLLGVLFISLMKSKT